MISLHPGMHAMRRMFGLRRSDITAAAVERWALDEPGVVEVRRARFLPDQLDRIRAAEFGTVAEVARDFIGGFASPQPPTMAFRLKQVLLLEGVLYAGDAVRHLKPRASRLVARLDPAGLAHGTLYESWSGNRWFGNWLSDDCLAYRLAEFLGQPVTTSPATGHKIDYERYLDMAPVRLASTRFDELILFDDLPHNEGKRRRAADLRRRLVGAEPPRHPGVFLLRGYSGEQRVLRNELEIAEALMLRRGFRVIDPSTASVAEIADACGGAEVVAGVEGSHLVHGLMLMPPGACLMVIQPPTRAVSVLKLITDRQGQDYSFVVGTGNNDGFSASVDEIERTLDLA